jgi:hypothetical protein
MKRKPKIGRSLPVPDGRGGVKWLYHVKAGRGKVLDENGNVITLREWELKHIDKMMLELERRGTVKKVRDAHGNVVTKLGKDGKPQILWERTALTAGHQLH